MNKENASKLWKMIQEAGDYLQGQLPDHPNHPKKKQSPEKTRMKEFQLLEDKRGLYLSEVDKIKRELQRM